LASALLPFAQHLAGQVAVVGGQLVAQHATCHRVPTAVDLQRIDLLEQPRQLQGIAQAEVDLRPPASACGYGPVR
jgi:hypothetical protein